jgi:hypothetical protein
VLGVDGSGFSLRGAPPLPVRLESQAFLDFSVVFQAANPGSYSAALHSDGISLLVTATVQQSLTYSVDSVPLGASPIVFGPVERLTSVTRHVRIENLAGPVLTVPAISVRGGAFRLASVLPSGIALQAREIAGFDIQFLPAASGTSEGTLVIGDRTFTLAGSAFDPPVPQPSLAVTLDQARSARQGTIAVQLDSPARTSGAGTLTLEFQPSASNATDPAIAFGTGSRTLPFTFSPGDTQPLTAVFQTGTTAGTLVFTVSLGGVSSRQTITIPLAPVTIAAVQSVRSATGVELRVTGFDNTRAAGAITYTFFDSIGNMIAPGAIQVDSTSDFTRFFQSSDAGGKFQLRAEFPVTGDPARIASFEITFTSPAGPTTSARTAIP